MSRSIARLPIVLAMLTVLVAAAAVSAPAASAALTHDFLNEVGAGSATPFEEPSAVAVDDQSGDVYVLDQKTGTVQKFTAAGAPAEIGTSGGNVLGTFTVVPLGGQLAVDNSGGPKDGTVYVATNGGVQAFSRDGSPATFPGAGAEAEGNLLKEYKGSPLGEVGSVAVDSKGDLYVGDSSETFIFGPTGKPLTSLQTGGGNAIGVAPSGRFYPSSGYIEPEAPGHVFIRLPEQYPPVENTNYENAPYELASSHGLGVDARSEHVLILGGKAVDEYEPTGTDAGTAGLSLLTSFGEGELASPSRAVAIDGNDGDVYIAAGAQVRRYGPLVKAPNVVTGPATEIHSGAGTATLHGTVDPLGEPVTRCEFEYGETTAYGRTAPCVETPSGTGAQAVHADLTGLTPADWHYRLVAEGPHGSLSGADRVFKIAGAPTVTSEEAAPGGTEVRLTATIGSGNGATSYFFEYGTGAGYGSRSATGTLSASFTPQVVSVSVAGLTPGTEYHFRAVATNEVATVGGEDETFTTTTGNAGGGCPNEALRLGYSALLPECRAYELVSPADKSGGDVYAQSGIQAAPSGDAVAFVSTYQFAGAASKSFENVYLATRGAEGWTTTATEAPQRNTNLFLEAPTLGLTPDLAESVQVSSVALTPGAIEGGTNIYLRDNATGTRTLIQALPEEDLSYYAVGQRAYGGITPGAARVFIKTEAPIEGEGLQLINSGLKNIFEYSDEGRRLISRLPDGTAVGAFIRENTRGLSSDGRQFVFQASNGSLYLHEPGKPTVAVGGEAPFVSGDGSTIVSSGSEGAGEGAGPNHGTPTVYAYDTASGRLRQLIEGPAGAQVTSILAVSPDDAYVYFGSTAKLTPDAPEEGSGMAGIYVWQKNAPAAQAIKFIVAVEPGEVSSGTTLGQVSPDGRSYAFGSGSRLTADDVASPGCERGGTSPAICTQVFEYEVATGKLSCTSCGAPGRPGTGIGGSERPTYGEHHPQAVLDGGVVYLETSSALSPHDSNGVTDVYQWRDGVARLISTGTSEYGSYFGDTADGGRDVFFKTNQPLVAEDTDTQRDLYDARVEGGIAAQNQTPVSVPCEGEGCHGASPGLSTLKTGAAPSCQGSALAAKRQAAREKAPARKAKKAKGKRARRLRVKAKGARRQATHLRKENVKCGRQGR